MLLGHKIKEIRTTLKLSLRAFDELTGISYGYIAKLERGQDKDGKDVVPTIDVLKQICDRSGYPFKQFLEETGYIEKDGFPTLKLVDERPPYEIIEENIHKLSKDELIMLEALVRYAKRDRE